MNLGPLLLVVVALLASSQSPAPSQAPVPSSPAMSPSEVAEAIAQGASGQGIEPILLGYGGDRDPYAVAHAFPPAIRVARAAYLAHRQGRSFTAGEVTASMVAPVVYVAVDSREEIDTITRPAARTKPAHLLILPKFNSRESDGEDAARVEEAPAVIPGFPARYDGRVFVVPLSGWTTKGYMVILEDPAVPGAGDIGRRVRCKPILTRK